MVKVTHKVKGREYEYPDRETAKGRCEQAVEQSEGRLSYKEEKDGSFTIKAAAANKED